MAQGGDRSDGDTVRYALETIAHHYALVMDLVHHYRAQMALRYLPIRYEDMVEDMSGSVRRMLDFIGESFDERCVNFQENRRLPHTPSYAQVTQKSEAAHVVSLRRESAEDGLVVPVMALWLWTGAAHHTIAQSVLQPPDDAMAGGGSRRRRGPRRRDEGRL